MNSIFENNERTNCKTTDSRTLGDEKFTRCGMDPMVVKLTKDTRLPM